MKVIKRGDKYRPKVGEPFILWFRRKKHIVKMWERYDCEGCPLYVLDGDRCFQYIACIYYPWDKHIVSAEEDIE